MRLINILAISTTASLLATAGLSQSAFDGTIGFQYMYAPDDSFDFQTQIDGSLVYSFSPKFEVQADIGSTFYEGNSSNDMDYGIHAIYAPSDMLDIGVYYGLEFDTSEFAGVEVAYSNGGIGVEAFYGWFDITNSTDASTVGIEAGYTFAPIGSMPGGINVYLGSTAFLNNGSVSIPSYYGGVRANVWNNLDINIRAASMDNGDYNYYTVGLSYSFGQGAVFTARDFASSFPGY